MAINKKGKRKITVNGKKYIWTAYYEVDYYHFNGAQIRIIAEDLSGFFKYGLDQEDTKRSVIIGVKNDQFKIRVFCPKFEDEDGIIRPAGIAKLIQWCLTYPDEENIRCLPTAWNQDTPPKKIAGADLVDYIKMLDELNASPVIP